MIEITPKATKEEESFEKAFKIVVLGDYSAGKPPFIIRYISGFFLEELKETISVDFYSKITDFKARRVNIQNHH